jgi:hypothetical protein
MSNALAIYPFAATVPYVDELRVMSEPIVGDLVSLMVRLSGEAEELSVDFLDASFNKVRREAHLRGFVAGWNTVNLNAKGLPKGDYFLSVRAHRGGEESFAQMVKTVVLRAF